MEVSGCNVKRWIVVVRDDLTVPLFATSLSMLSSDLAAATKDLGIMGPAAAVVAASGSSYTGLVAKQ